MRRLRILATLTCTATVADAATNAGTETARSWQAVSRIADRQRREKQGRPPMQVIDE